MPICPWVYWQWVDGMAYAYSSAGALDYSLCSYGASRLLFRGPRRQTDRAYVAVMGGSECFGRFVPRPFSQILEKELGLPVVNLAQQNAGTDVYLLDPYILHLAGQASVTVLQITGAQNISNRFYTVHPRRNDRFLAASSQLRALFPHVDFTEYHFTRHLLMALQHASPLAFANLVEGLRADWVHHMRKLLAQMGGQVVLLWIGDAPPQASGAEIDLFANPMLIDRTMMEEVGQKARDVVYAIASPAARAKGTEGMAFDPIDLPVAAALPGPYVHREIADALLPRIEALMQPGGRAT
jgi:hypothetical protein